MGFFSVNREFLPFKLHYGLLYGGIGAVMPFMPVYAKVLGLSSRMVGTVYSIAPIFSLICQPLFGAIADKFKIHRYVLLGWEFIIMTAYFSCYMIPPPPQAGSGLDDSVLIKLWQFWLFVPLLALAWAGSSVAGAMSDMMCTARCNGDSIKYGLQRCWGSWGLGLSSVIVGVLIDVTSKNGETNYAPAFYFLLGPFILDIICSFILIKVDIPARSQNIGSDVWKALMIPRNAIFTIWCGFEGVSFGFLWSFLFWHLEDLAGEGTEMALQVKTIEGVVVGVQCFIGEGPAFFFSGWIINKIGHSHTMSLVFLALGIRFVLYSILVNPWWCIPIEIFQNQYGLYYATVASYAKKIGAPGTEATIQSVLCAVCEGLGIAIGSYTGGYFYDNYGGKITFHGYGIMFFCLAATNECLEAIFWLLNRRQKRQETQM